MTKSPFATRQLFAAKAFGIFSTFIASSAKFVS